MDFFFKKQSFCLLIDDKSTGLHGIQMGLWMCCFIFPIKSKECPRNGKNKALNFSEAKFGKLCVIHWTKDTGLDINGKKLRVNYGKFSDYVLWKLRKIMECPHKAHRVTKWGGKGKKIEKVFKALWCFSIGEGAQRQQLNNCKPSGWSREWLSSSQVIFPPRLTPLL